MSKPLILKEEETLSVKEVAPNLNLAESTIRKYVSRGKILATKDKRGRCMFTMEEINRYKDKKNLFLEAIKDHFSIQELEGMNLPRSLVIDGVIESKMVEGKYYVHFKELKRYLKTVEPCSTLPSKVCKKKLKVTNRGGLHCRPSAKIIQICNEYLHKGLSVKISHKNKDWLFPSMGILELLELSVHYLETITVHIEGDEALFCMKDLTKAFKNGFDVTR